MRFFFCHGRVKILHTALHTGGRHKRVVGDIFHFHLVSGFAGEYHDFPHYIRSAEIEPWIGREGIEYVGPVDDAQKNVLLGGARAMVVPIQWDEPFGIVFAEALACGTPVISCPRGALPEIVRPGIEGFLIRSIEEGCEAVSRLATIDRAACRRRAEDHFSPAAVVARYLGLYAKVRAGMSRG